MKNIVVSNWSLVLAFALVLVSIGISAKEKLGLTKDILISVIRAIIQLVVIGYVLKFIFHVNTLWLTLVSTIVIIFNASWNANQRDPNPGRNIWNSIIAEAVGTYATLGILSFSGENKPVPMQVIPITGMIEGNEMGEVGLWDKAWKDRLNELHQKGLEK